MSSEAWVALGIGLAGTIITVLSAVWYIASLLSRSLTRFEIIGVQQATEISRMNLAIEKIETTMASVAVDRERAAGMERRITILERWYDELRRGIGRIDP